MRGSTRGGSWGCPWLLGSAEAMKDWDVETVSRWSPAGSWGSGFSEVQAASKAGACCRGDRCAGRDRGWGSGGFPYSDCHLCLPGISGWAGRKHRQGAGL